MEIKIYWGHIKSPQYPNKCDYVFCCISDFLNPGKDDSGSHWSLLILDKAYSKAYHIDSLTKLTMHEHSQ